MSRHPRSRSIASALRTTRAGALVTAAALSAWACSAGDDTANPASDGADGGASTSDSRRDGGILVDDRDPSQTRDDATDAGDDDPGFDTTLTDGGARDASSVACSPPRLTFVLSRATSMGRAFDGTRPTDTPENRAATRWGATLEAIRQTTAAPFDRGVRFGLALTPKGPNGASADLAGCVRLANFLQGTNPTNEQCLAGSTDIVPALERGAALASMLSTDTLPLCRTQPLAATLDRVREELASGVPSPRDAVVLFLDGNDNCGGSPIDAVGRLAAAGISTYVVGIGGPSDVERKLWNDLACAGRTAFGFASACTLADAGGAYVAKASAAGNTVYRPATNGAMIRQHLTGIRDQIGCAPAPVRPEE